MTASAPAGALSSSPIGTLRLAVRRRGWLSLVLALLIAFVGQNSIVEGHVDLPATVGGLTTLISGVASPTIVEAPRPSKPAIPCPLCRALADQGKFLRGDAVALAARGRVAVPPSRTERRVGITPRPTHSWQSRGPPRAA